MAFCTCDLRDRRWNPGSGKCEFCGSTYFDEQRVWPGVSTKDVSGKLGHHEGADMTEAEFLAAYKARAYPRPSVTVDLVIFTVLHGVLHVLLIVRGGHPFRGCQAFPGGFVDAGDDEQDQGEDLDEAAHRELEEETGLPRGSCHLEQLYTFGKAYRDPRTRTITVAYLALVRSSLAPLVRAQDDAAEAGWTPVQELLDALDAGTTKLAFDHADILRMAVQRLRGKIDYTSIAFDLVPDTFSAGDLRQVYEAVKGRSYNAKTFHSKFRRMITDGVILPVPGSQVTGGRRAAMFRFNRQ